MTCGVGEGRESSSIPRLELESPCFTPLWQYHNKSIFNKSLDQGQELLALKCSNRLEGWLLGECTAPPEDPRVVPDKPIRQLVSKCL